MVVHRQFCRLMLQKEFTFEKSRLIHGVSEIVEDIRSTLEKDFRDIWVQGEISDFAVPRSGHFYFNLKDDEARLRCVCFRMENRYLRFRPEEGLEVIARGRISVYPPRGDVQFIVQHMEPVGHGALRLAFDRLKERLWKEGLFDEERKKPIPRLPAKIGVITSPTGAAVQDILRVLARRNIGLDVLIYPVKVQGEGAAREIVRGIKTLDRRDDLDTLILARGGGSAEDLQAFNEEIVARAIAETGLPLISAIGHEVDVTISDFAADLRAPTPSAAAEIVTGAREELAGQVDQLNTRLTRAIQVHLHTLRNRLQTLISNRSFVDSETRLRLYQQRLDDLTIRLMKPVPLRLGSVRERKLHLDTGLRRTIGQVLAQKRTYVENRTARLTAVSPLAVLDRGYAIVTGEGGDVVVDPNLVRVGDRISIRVARGDFAAKRVESE